MIYRICFGSTIHFRTLFFYHETVHHGDGRRGVRLHGDFNAGGADLAQTSFGGRRVCPLHERGAGAEPDYAAFDGGATCRAVVDPDLGRAGGRIVSAGAHHGGTG